MHFCNLVWKSCSVETKCKEIDACMNKSNKKAYQLERISPGGKKLLGADSDFRIQVLLYGSTCMMPPGN